MQSIRFTQVVVSSLTRRRFLAVAVAAFALSIPAALAAPDAQAQRCPVGEGGYVSTIHTSCAEAKVVLGKALKKIPLAEFRVFVHGWWHCSYTEITGNGTFTAERKYGTPQRQVVIVVV